MNQFDRYVLSGNLGRAVVLGPIAACAAAIVLGIAYSYVNVYSPIAGYISLLFVAGFAFGLGWVVSKAGHAGKCRNPAFMGFLGLASGLVGLYASWVAFEYALLRRYDDEFTASLIEVFLSPGFVWELAKAINQEGWYSIGSMTPKGAVLWVLWGMEAMVIVGVPALMAAQKINNSVFCERCDDWCREVSNHTRLVLPEDEAKTQAVAAGDPEALLQVPAYHEQGTPHVSVDAWSCQRCEKTAALRTKLVQFKAGKDGGLEEESKELSPILVVDPSFLHKLREHSVPEVASP